jgi:hypothetical protein
VNTHSDEYAFALSVKTGGVERTICDPVILKLFTHGPSQLDFAALCVSWLGRCTQFRILTNRTAFSLRKPVYPLAVCIACECGFVPVMWTTVSSPTMSFGLAKTRTSGLSRILVLRSSQVAHRACLSIKDSLEKPWLIL